MDGFLIVWTLCLVAWTGFVFGWHRAVVEQRRSLERGVRALDALTRITVLTRQAGEALTDREARR